jgi:hypothetical protein
MNRPCVFFSAALVTLSLIFYPFTPHAMMIPEKKETPLREYPRVVQQQNESPDLQNGLGVKEFPRSDGGTDKMYYSIVTPEEEKKKEREEKEKQDRSWDLLPGIIIDKRAR